MPEADGAAGTPLVDGSQLAADGTVTPLASASHDGAETPAGASASQEKPEAEAAQPKVCSVSVCCCCPFVDLFIIQNVHHIVFSKL